MARRLKVGDTVYVPRARLGLAVDGASAFWRSTVHSVMERSVEVDLPGGEMTSVASSAAHLNMGVVIVRIGDYQTETTLLDPLKKSLLHYCRLLLPDDMVQAWDVRAPQELRELWKKNHRACSHLVVIGHGRDDAIRFGLDDWVDAATFAELLQASKVTQKIVTSLACKTGYAAFAQALSREKPCDVVMAPFHAVHGAVASQFCETLLAHHLLRGETLSIAFRHARASVPGAVIFRLWDHGKLTAGARS